MELRHYQKTAIEQLAHRELTVLPTGTGKTAIFAEVGVRHYESNYGSEGAYAADLGSFVILVHREELIEQTEEALVRAGLPRNVIGVVQGPVREWHKPVVIAMQQTAKQERRLTDLPEKIGTLIVDEAHRYTTKQTATLLDACEDRGAKIFGFSATPWINNKPIWGAGRPFTGISYKRSIPAFVREGYLCDVVARSIAFEDLDLSKIKQSKVGGFADYDAGALGAKLSSIHAPERIAEAWFEYAQGRKRTIVFTPTVEFGRETAEAFRALFRGGLPKDKIYGPDAAVVEVYGHTPTEQRRKRIEAIRTGKAQVMVNVLVGAEGFDVPEIDCVVQARPTKSWTLYTQTVGRGLRIAPGKQNLLVLDIAGNAADHDIATLPRVLEVPDFGKKKGKDGEAQSLRELLDEQDAKSEKAPKEYEHSKAVLGEVLLYAPIHWSSWGDEWIATLDRDNVVVIAPVVDEDEKVTLSGVFSVNLKTHVETDLGCFHYANEAQEEAEEHIRANGDSKLFRRAERWRLAPPSDGQLRWFRGVAPDKLPKTRGEAAERITLALYQRARRA